MVHFCLTSFEFMLGPIFTWHFGILSPPTLNHLWFFSTAEKCIILSRPHLSSTSSLGFLADHKIRLSSSPWPPSLLRISFFVKCVLFPAFWMWTLSLHLKKFCAADAETLFQRRLCSYFWMFVQKVYHLNILYFLNFCDVDVETLFQRRLCRYFHWTRVRSLSTVTN